MSANHTPNIELQQHHLIPKPQHHHQHHCASWATATLSTSLTSSYYTDSYLFIVVTNDHQGMISDPKQGSRPVCWAARRAVQNQSLWVHRKESETRLGRLRAQHENDLNKTLWNYKHDFMTKWQYTTALWLVLPSLITRDALCLHVGFQDLSDFIPYQDSPTSTKLSRQNCVRIIYIIRRRCMNV